jgi:hypothetical protein
MRWRVFGELERNPSAIRLLQCEDKAPVTIFEILVDDFKFAFELRRFPLSGLQLSRYSRVVSQIAACRVVCQ